VACVYTQDFFRIFETGEPSEIGIDSQLPQFSLPLPFMHKAGFVSIIGAPNAGKSTLMNALVGEKLSIITPKAQTTRHKIIGIVNGDDYQIVFTDTPGIIDPSYTLHNAMMKAVDEGINEADLVLFVATIGDVEPDEAVAKKLNKVKAPLVVLINKIDLSDQDIVTKKLALWQKLFPNAQILPISALNKFNLDGVKQIILGHLPDSPPYFEKDQLTDKSQRFFAAEIIREKIFLYYKKEIPYSTEVEIYSFKDEPNLITIDAYIYVMRETQKKIVIGNNATAIKSAATAARQGLENFFGKKVMLKTLVKVKDNWRDNSSSIKNFGYDL
jgi:GTP-binding protein Era